ncbi:MAG: segregation and condensation protein B [Flavobacteriaceae bacterium]|jgi:segregation and condensation protein B
MNIEHQIEAYLFIKSEPVSLKSLIAFFNIPEEELLVGLNTLKESLSGRGIGLVEHTRGYYLSTNPLLSEMTQGLLDADMNAPLTPATIETFAIILYNEGASKGEVDYIRGVNSTQTIRTLLIRGLIERHIHPEDKRMYTYTATPDALSYLGLSSIDELPDIKIIQDKFHNYEEIAQKEDASEE